MAKSKNKPLSGRTIAVTRATDQVSELSRKLTDVGAEVLELPLIEIHPDVDSRQSKEIYKELWTYEWLIFTSANGVRHFFESFFSEFDDIRALGGLRIATVGKATADAVKAYYLRVDLMPEYATAEELAKALQEEQTLDNLKLLIVTGNRNSEALAERLEAAMAIVDTLQVYRTEKTDLSKHAAAKTFRKQGADAIIFASSSAVESFVAQAEVLQIDAGAKRPIGCSIGPVTSDTMRRVGMPVDVVAKTPSLDAVVEALSAHFSGGAK